MLHFVNELKVFIIKEVYVMNLSCSISQSTCPSYNVILLIRIQEHGKCLNTLANTLIA